MSTPTAEVVWSWLDLPDDSHITEAVISASVKARAELDAAVVASREARGAR